MPHLSAHGLYSSPSIRERRRRILESARQLIEEQGLTGLNMDEVCQRAGVAKRTLYNAFQSKEGLIAAAVQQYFQTYSDQLRGPLAEATLDNVVERLTLVLRRTVELGNYVRALSSIYHSAETDAEIWREIHDFAVDYVSPLIHRMRERRQLKPWVHVPTLIDSLVRVRFGVTNAWAQGHIRDELLPYVMLTSMLVHVAGAARGTALTEVEERLGDLAAGRLVVDGERVPTPETLAV